MCAHVRRLCAAAGGGADSPGAAQQAAEQGGEAEGPWAAVIEVAVTSVLLWAQAVNAKALSAAATTDRAGAAPVQSFRSALLRCCGRCGAYHAGVLCVQLEAKGMPKHCTARLLRTEPCLPRFFANATALESCILASLNLVQAAWHAHSAGAAGAEGQQASTPEEAPTVGEALQDVEHRAALAAADPICSAAEQLLCRVASLGPPDGPPGEERSPAGEHFSHAVFLCSQAVLRATGLPTSCRLRALLAR